MAERLERERQAKLKKRTDDTILKQKSKASGPFKPTKRVAGIRATYEGGATGLVQQRRKR